MITWENYEEYMMMYADGELKPAEVQALMDFLDVNPGLRKELAAYEMVKMVPDSAIVFENKASLNKEESGRRVIAFPVWQRYGIAAGIALLLFISIFKYRGSQDSLASIIADTTRAQPAQQQPAIPQPPNTIAVADTALKAMDTADDDRVAVDVPEEEQTDAVSPVTKEPRRQTNTPVVQMLVNTVNEHIGKMSPDDVRELPRTSVAVAAPAVASLPAAAAEVDDNSNPQRRTLLSRLPIDERKKQGIENVATALASGVDKINAIKEDIEDRSITIKVERRRLILSF